MKFDPNTFNFGGVDITHFVNEFFELKNARCVEAEELELAAEEVDDDSAEKTIVARTLIAEAHEAASAHAGRPDPAKVAAANRLFAAATAQDLKTIRMRREARDLRAEHDDRILEARVEFITRVREFLEVNLATISSGFSPMTGAPPRTPVS